eukprot:gnl/MRDRNA2_/MRDRNA2_59784_c0_seq1.p1 gnl/MRDRNA2_/MRDRNA2_59784_c0~~gnl/MRDRNA2_/MRDRNA2_59784_c0_seq1.p1  ORF type:complete len:641 (+),score=146.64 gnl/MRDRNA2_/MRDRNA2_59784_c0_seq1:133-2055(+)
MSCKLPFLIVPNSSGQQSLMASKRAYERPPRCTTRLPTLKSQSKKLQQTLRPSMCNISPRKSSVPSTRASSAMSTRAPSSCSAAMSSDGEEDTPREEVVLRQAVLDQIEYSLAPAPSMKAPKQKSSMRPAPLTTNGSKAQSDIKLQLQQSRTARASKGKSRNTNEAPTRRRTLVENVKQSLRERKSSRSATKANISSQVPEDDVGLAANQNQFLGMNAMLPVSQALGTTQKSPSIDNTLKLAEEPNSASVCIDAENVIQIGVEVTSPDKCDIELESNAVPSEAVTATESINASETSGDTALTPKLLESSSGPSKLRKRLMRACSRELMRVMSGEFQLASPDVQAARKAFLSYDLDGNGSLDAGEFGKLLRDQGVDVSYQEALEASRTVSGQKDGTVDFDAFKNLFARAQKEENKEAQGRHGFSADEADLLRAVFDKYDVTHNQKLEGFELARFLQDIGKAPGSSEEQRSLRQQLEQARGGVLGPLTFKHFLAFVRLLDMECEVEEEKQREEAAKRAGLSKMEVEQLKEVFEANAQHQETLCCSQVYELLRHGLHLHAGEGQHEAKVRAIVQSHALNNDVAAGVDFPGFLGVIGDVVAETRELLVQDPSPMNISKFNMRSVSSVVAPITAILKLQKSTEEK